MKFENLQSRADSPAAGIFFLQDEHAYPTIRTGATVTATGVAFLIHESGLLATCAHVVIEAGGYPGGRVLVHSAMAPVSIVAEVIYSLWRGPPYDELEGFPQGLFFDGIDKRPEVFQQDLAVLRLIPETARWHEQMNARGELVLLGDLSPEVTDPVECLLRTSRVLPVGTPGYRSRGAPLIATCLVWCLFRFGLRAGHVTFQSRDTQAYNAILIRGSDIRPGFSGSPLWDSERQMVVGIIRRMFLDSTDYLASALDGAFLVNHLNLAQAMDARLTQLCRLAEQQALVDVQAFEATNPVLFVEPQVSLLEKQDSLVDNVATAQITPGVVGLIDALQNHRFVLLFGAAGSGKTTLLRQLATRILRERIRLGDQFCVPIFVTAGDLIVQKFDLRQLIGQMRARFDAEDPAESLVQCVAENDACIALLVDGLDELSSAEMGRVFLQLAALQNSHKASRANADGLIKYILVGSRLVSTKHLNENSRTRHNFRPYLLKPFDRSRTGTLCDALFPIATERERFGRALASIRWDRDEPTPLQIVTAAEVFSYDQTLPKNAHAITQAFVDKRISDASSRAIRLGNEDNPDSFKDSFRPNLPWILEFIARESYVCPTYSTNDLRQGVEKLLCESKGPSWLRDRGSFIQFIRQELAPLTGLISIREEFGEGESRYGLIAWAHRTFHEHLVARWLWRERTVPGKTIAFDPQIGPTVQLYFLAIAEEVKDFRLVAYTLNEWLREGPAVRSASARKAMNALASGIDAGGTMRGLLVKELVRIVLAESELGIACTEIFSDPELPSAVDLISRPELRSDVIVAISCRLQTRVTRSRATQQHPVVRLTAREAKLFEKLRLWTELDVGVELIGPDSGTTAAPRSVVKTAKRIDPQLGINRQTVIFVRHEDGQVKPLQLPTDDFLNAVVQVARERLSARSEDVLGLVITGMLDLPKLAVRQPI